MLEPRSAIGSVRGRRSRARSSAAIAAMSSSARPSIGPALAPWPRWSNAIAANPAREHGARVVVVALLARSGAVQDHDAAPRRRPSSAATASRRARRWRRSRSAAPARSFAVRAHARDHVSRDPAWHDRRPMTLTAAAALARLPARHAASTSAATSRSAAATRSSSPASSARRRTSSPRTTCAPARGRSSTRWPRATPTSTCCSPPRRSRARPSTGCSPRRGWRATSPPAASWRWRCGAASIPRGSTSTATPSPSASCARRSTPASDTSCSTRSTSSSGSSGSRRELGRRQEVLIRVTPGVAGDTHDAISTGQADSKFGFSVDEAREAIERLRSVAAPGPRRPALPHRLAAVRARAVPARGPRDRASSATSRSTTSAAGSASPTRRPSTRRRSPSYVEALVERAARGARAPTSGCCSSRAGRWSRTRRSRCTRCRPSSATSRPGSPSTAACRTTCGRCCTASVYEAMIADRPLAPATERCQIAGKHCESGDVIVRDAPLPDPAAGRRARDARSPARTATRWPTTTTACRARR